MPIVLAWLSFSLNKKPRPWFLASLPSSIGSECVCEYRILLIQLFYLKVRRPNGGSTWRFLLVAFHSLFSLWILNGLNLGHVTKDNMKLNCEPAECKAMFFYGFIPSIITSPATSMFYGIEGNNTNNFLATYTILFYQTIRLLTTIFTLFINLR